MLSLDLTDPGFDASVLCEFRQRLLEGEAEQQILQPLLDLCTGYLIHPFKKLIDYHCQ
jgi:hypothetical protein